MSGGTRLVQLSHRESGRRCVARVEEPFLHILAHSSSVVALAQNALAARTPLAAHADTQADGDAVRYDDVYHGHSAWRLLPPIDHPDEPARCVVSGTGLTHRRSVDTRQAMHGAGAALTDSMRMYELGVAGGRPDPGAIGVAPEWFYKGTGLCMRAHGEPLPVPAYAEDGGEEPEIAGVYFVAADGAPVRLGMVIGNEFADHKLERRNYLYLAPSKLRMCALGPELVLEPDFADVHGTVAIERDDALVWSRAIRSGDAAMCHSLENLEHHHFKFELHRRPGDVHVHFFGADAFSFSEGVELEDGDVMRVAFTGFGRPLRNPLAIAARPEPLVRVRRA